MTNRLLLLITLFTSVLLGSCITRKNTIYMQKSEAKEKILMPKYEATFEVGDLLSIEISTIDPEVAKPFNQTELVRQGTNQTTTYQNGVPASIGYLINTDSTVTLPIVGKVKIAGFERSRAIDTIKVKVSEYLDNPTISAQILNYKVTVLGDVKHPGTFNIPNGRITILEAIGIAEDLNITGKRKNVLVMRNEGGELVEYRLDFTSQNFFTSPAYYLRQNDIVYIEPNRAALFNGSVFKAAGSTILASASLIVSTLILITK